MCELEKKALLALLWSLIALEGVILGLLVTAAALNASWILAWKSTLLMATAWMLSIAFSAAYIPIAQKSGDYLNCIFRMVRDVCAGPRSGMGVAYKALGVALLAQSASLTAAWIATAIPVIGSAAMLAQIPAFVAVFGAFSAFIAATHALDRCARGARVVTAPTAIWVFPLTGSKLEYAVLRCNHSGPQFCTASGLVAVTGPNSSEPYQVGRRFVVLIKPPAGVTIATLACDVTDHFGTTLPILPAEVFAPGHAYSMVNQGDWALRIDSSDLIGRGLKVEPQAAKRVWVLSVTVSFPADPAEVLRIRCLVDA